MRYMSINGLFLLSFVELTFGAYFYTHPCSIEKRKLNGRSK